MPTGKTVDQRRNGRDGGSSKKSGRKHGLLDKVKDALGLDEE